MLLACMQLVCMQLACMQLLCMHMLCMHMLLAFRLYTQAVCSWPVCTCCWSQAVYTGSMQLLCMHMLLASGCMHKLYAAALYAHAAGLRLYTQAVCSCSVCSSSVCTCCWPVCSLAVGAALACMQLLICIPISSSQHQTSHCKIATDKYILTCTPAPRWGSLQHP